VSIDATGVVVAGGHSTRFGDREKALAELDGEPMLRRVVDALATMTDDIVVNCRPDQHEAFAAALDGADTDVRFALDEETDEGPLAGLRTALSAVETDDAVVLGCDMPLVDPDALSALLEELRESDADAVVPQTAGGAEPLHAAYRVEPTLAAARAALDDGERSLRALLDQLVVRYLDAEPGVVPPQSLTSVDTESRLAEITSRTDGDRR